MNTRRRRRRRIKALAVLLAMGTFTASSLAVTPRAEANPLIAPPVVNGVVMVSTAAELEYIDQNPGAYIESGSSTTYLTANIDLMSNIDLSGYAWVPLGLSGARSAVSFSGALNGLGHEITGLSITSTSDFYVGLFAETSGEIKNLGLDVTISDAAGHGSVGGIVGWETGGKISDCYVTGSVSGQYVVLGGLVGEEEDGSISDCYVTASVGSSLRYAGALLGGQALGSMSASYFDVATTHHRNGLGLGSSSGAIGVSSDLLMKSASTYSGWDFTNTWRKKKNKTR